MTLELNPRFTFATFVAGPSNQLAVTAARAVAESPGSVYNPLFVYSDTGLGKTHLMMAVGHRAREVQREIAVEYLTLEEFIEAFHAAVGAGQGEAFRNRFVGVDVMLVDDVQFLASRLETQTELLRFVNGFLEAGKQIVLTSDRPPNELQDLDERLISRFAGGLVVDIAPPEYETRLAILQRKMAERGMEFDARVLETVASVEVKNVRELLGLLNRLIAFQAVNESAISPEQARRLLGEDEPPAAAAAAPEAAAAVPAPEGGETAAPPPDEFQAFLSTVGSALAQQMDAWRRRLHEAVVYWEGEGYRADRIKRLLEQDAPVGADAVVAEFEQAVERLRALQDEMNQLDPGRAGEAAFYDPDRLEDAAQLVQRAREGLAPPPGPSAAWAFEDFVAAESNRVALNSAQAVTASPGGLYNPFVIVGPTGVGKTHLLHGIGHALAVVPDALVACLSAQDFIDELVQAIDRGRLDTWRSRYRRVTGLLVDDVHLFAGKERSQRELFNLFNALLDAGRQLAFTCHVPPREVEGLDDRLISRLEGGLVVEIQPPDRDLRLALVTRELEERAGEVDADVAAYLADRPATSLRSVIGLVQRVVEAAETQAVSVSLALAREILDGAPVGSRRSAGMRTSGIVISPHGGVRSREKMVWQWPAPADRIVEEVG